MKDKIAKLIEELNDEQRLAAIAPINSCTKIVAGAGTGKTKIISKRFVKLVFDLIEKEEINPISHILVITFTDKAANEMKGRIIKALDENNLSSCCEEYWVSTFHSFCNKILRKHSIEANLSPDFELAEETTLYKVYLKLIKKLKYNEYNLIEDIDKISSYLKLEKEILDIQNIKALSVIDKLDNVFEYIFKVIKKIKSVGITPKEFLDATLEANEAFANKVATLPFGMKAKEEYMTLWENHLKKYSEDFSDYEVDGIFNDLTSLICKNGSRKAEKWSQIAGYPEKIVDFNKIDNYLTRVIAFVYAIYQKMLEDLDLVDFDDLINKTIYIFKKNNEIRTYYQEFFKHIIIDEFQDTNGAQLELIKLLLNESEPNITFVGDRKQSIYGFRHAQMENLEVLHKYIEEKYEKKYPEIKLVTNYRSDSHVLNLVNYTTTECLRLDEALFSGKKESLKTENKDVKNIQLIGCQNEYDRKINEVKYIASEINSIREQKNEKYSDFAILVKSHAQSELIEKELLAAGIPSEKRASRSFFTDSVVKNACALLKLLKNPLNEVALVRLLKVILSDEELYKVKIKVDSLYSNLDIAGQTKRVTFAEKTIKLFELDLLENELLKNIYLAISKAIEEKQIKTLLQLFLDLQESVFLYYAKTDVEHFQNRNKLKIFEKIIFDYEQNKNYTNVTQFLEYFDKISEDKTFELPKVSSAGNDAVQILTIYASKGLEFKHVFVCGISSRAQNDKDRIVFDLQYGKKPGFGLFVTKMNDMDSFKKIVYNAIWKKPRERNEDKRVFYVAVSRAQSYLNVLSFDDLKGSKPAEYTKDFPNYVISKKINVSEIEETKGTYTFFKHEEKKQNDDLLEIKKEENEEKEHKFSFSKINNFKICPQKFILKYKYGYASLHKSSGAQIGNIVHKLIYNSFLYQKDFNEQEVLNFVSLANLENYVKDSVKNMYGAFISSPYSVSNLKKLEVYSERTFNFVYGLGGLNIEFSGDIDLLIKNEDNTYSIIDFKTNKDIEKDKYGYYLQLYLYKTAMEAEGLKVKETMLVSLKDDGKFAKIILENENNVKQEFDNLLFSAVNCLNGQEKPVKNENMCKYCELKYACIAEN